MIYGSQRSPKIGVVETWGMAYFVLKEVPLLGPTAVRVVNVRATPQQMMIWDDVDQNFNQFERMLRDAGRVTHKGKSLVEEAGVALMKR